jgi:hypothetical protein
MQSQLQRDAATLPLKYAKNAAFSHYLDLYRRRCENRRDQPTPLYTSYVVPKGVPDICANGINLQLSTLTENFDRGFNEFFR